MKTKTESLTNYGELKPINGACGKDGVRKWSMESVKKLFILPNGSIITRLFL
jgi:hypothetical protein